MRKINVLIIYYKALGQLHKKENKKSKHAKRNKNRECEGVGPFKEIKLELMIKLLNEKKELIFYVFGFMKLKKIKLELKVK